MSLWTLAVRAISHGEKRVLKGTMRKEASLQKVVLGWEIPWWFARSVNSPTGNRLPWHTLLIMSASGARNRRICTEVRIETVHPP